MTDEFDLDLSEDKPEEIITRKDKKISSLSNKLAEEAKAREEAAQKAVQEAEARANAEKERDFFRGFSQISSKYQGATEYQDQIWEKVKSGYDIEDATTSTLIKEGKFQPIVPQVDRQVVAGGSATTSMSGGDRSPNEMTQAERRQALADLEAKGEFSL